MSAEISNVRPDGTPYPVQLDEAALTDRLDPLSYEVLRRAATERPFTGEYTDADTVGVYRCKACGAELFRSETKFHSGCGWPSFYEPSSSDAVVLLEDRLLGYPRVEVRCASCGSHLGHVFRGEGYPVPTDERWCINSVSLTLAPLEPAEGVASGGDRAEAIADRFRTVAAGFTDRVQGVGAGRWEQPAPCDGWVARDVVAHLVEWVPSFVLATWDIPYAAGASVADDPAGAWAAVRDAVQAGLDDPAVSGRRRDSPMGPKTYAEAVDAFVLQDVLVHTWDLARATGQDERLDPSETERQAAAIAGIPPEVDRAMRESGHFGPRVAVPSNADAQTRLLAFVGRRVS